MFEWWRIEEHEFKILRSWWLLPIARGHWRAACRDSNGHPLCCRTCSCSSQFYHLFSHGFSYAIVNMKWCDPNEQSPRVPLPQEIDCGTEIYRHAIAELNGEVDIAACLLGTTLVVLPTKQQSPRKQSKDRRHFLPQLDLVHQLNILSNLWRLVAPVAAGRSQKGIKFQTLSHSERVTSKTFTATASHFVSQLHLQRPPDSEDESNRNQFSGENDDNSHQGMELGTSNTSSGDMVANRQRGRPPGSKNKPKPPVINTRESANSLCAHILEVSSGCDVFEAVAAYVRKRQRGICILGGTGTVNNVTIRQPALW
ncbi:unnamed protein product [Fraxinus pennsylvanica]|uniref:PPC domain-containing protein n=1 Tax=Fraxinus pennsylvanica TaxID=56036 RepID=A0AAD1Z330_9LAMI|nr:unnamed protein product [Fraxinus pennsylvanica]